MRNSKIKSMMVLSLVGLLTACGGGRAETFTIDANVKYGLGGRVAKTTYNALLATSVGNLNYLETQESQDAQHFANFVDGLLLHNQFGVLEHNLATKVEHNADYTEFKFTVRKNVPWMRYDGKQYVATVGSKKQKQWVSPEDWVTTAKAVCNYTNQSGLEYLIGMFVKGAEEYHWYTYIEKRAADGDRKFQNMLERPALAAAEINKQIEKNSPTVWTAMQAAGEEVTGDMIPSIKDGSRFGVKANMDDYTVTYQLIQPASYFPTLFTYSCYLPTNEHFLKDTRFTQFGTDKDKILYNGPFLLNTYSEKGVQYLKNEGYWNKDAVHFDVVNYSVLSDEISSDYTRTEFEEGRIDGFGINSKDAKGWKKYITGEDENGNPGDGTIENPADPLVNANLTDTIGQMFGSNIVMGRDITNSTTSYSKAGNAQTVKNTARALSLTPVRAALMAGLDYPLYFQRHGTEKILQTQMMVHTYVPRNFVIDDDGLDYVKGHYLPEYAAKKGIDVGEWDDDGKCISEGDSAAKRLEPGQYESRIVDQEGMNKLVDTAKLAIQKYNEDSTHEKITYPINIEYFSAWDADTQTQQEDKRVINSMNKRLNYGNDDRAVFNVIPTDKVNQQNLEIASRSGCFDYAPVQWGWGADYGDPLSFMNTYRKGGDWGDVFPFIDAEYVPNFRLVGEGADAKLVESDLLGEYTNLVAEGASETQDMNTRYDIFAEAEYLLIEDLQFYKPQVNYGQGWNVSISRAVGYYNPSASYGLANDRLDGLYVLTSEDMFNRADRIAARKAHKEDKHAYVAEHGSMNIYYDELAK